MTFTIGMGWLSGPTGITSMTGGSRVGFPAVCGYWRGISGRGFVEPVVGSTPMLLVLLLLLMVVWLWLFLSLLLLLLSLEMFTLKR